MPRFTDEVTSADRATVGQHTWWGCVGEEQSSEHSPPVSC